MQVARGFDLQIAVAKIGKYSVSESGDTVELTLEFEDVYPITVDVAVIDSLAGDVGADDHDHEAMSTTDHLAGALR